MHGSGTEAVFFFSSMSYNIETANIYECDSKDNRAEKSKRQLVEKIQVGSQQIPLEFWKIEYFQTFLMYVS